MSCVESRRIGTAKVDFAALQKQLETFTTTLLHKTANFQGCSRIKAPLQFLLIGPDETRKTSHGWFLEQMLAVSPGNTAILSRVSNAEVLQGSTRENRCGHIDEK